MLCYVRVECDNFGEVLELEDFGKGAGWDVYSKSWFDIVFVRHTDSAEVTEFVDNIDDMNFAAIPYEADHSGHKTCNELQKCDESGEFYYSRDLRQLPNGNWVNSDDFAEVAGCCDNCGETHWTENLASTPGTDYYCQDCYSETVSECYDCGREEWRDDMLYNEDYGADYCTDCYPRTGVDEFDGRSKSFDPANSFGSSRYFGVELETDCGRCSHQFAFDGKEDGTIDGTEFVSHKLRGDAGLAEVRDFMASGDDIEISSSCGLHLHMDVEGLSDEQLYAIFAAYAATEGYWFGQVSSERDGNCYCMGLPDSTVEEVFAAYRDGRSFYSFCDYRDRFFWMNCRAYIKHGSFENRLHHGTWDYKKVERWVILNLRFVEAVKDIPLDDTMTFKTFVVDALENAKAYFTPVSAVA